MTDQSFEHYGERAEAGLDYTEMSGRYSIQEDAERRIVNDLLQKLKLVPEDRLLEIGCGPGNLIIPLSFLVEKSFGIDHPEIINKLEERYSDDSLVTIGGNFMDVSLEQKFTKILIYSVVNYLATREALYSFVDKALEYLEPGGRLLLGDLPNQDKKERFQASEKGKEFQKEWETRMENQESEAPDLPEEEYLSYTDELITDLLQRYRDQGYEAYLYPQPSNLPYGYTREDVVITSRK